MRSDKILIIRAGETLPEIAREQGCFDAWILRELDLLPGQYQIVSAFQGEALPCPHDYQGIIVTGSHSMVTDREPWSERLAEWIAKAILHTPYLGICYGHQLLAHAMGGIVGPLPGGIELGATPMRLTPEAADDPIFRHLPPVFPVNTSHQQSVLILPPGAILLAASPSDPHHAFRLGAHAWGIQFHPEFNRDAMRSYIVLKASHARAHGQNPESLLASLTPTPDAATILKLFLSFSRSR